jgi:surfeit locus 1 family protein
MRHFSPTVLGTLLTLAGVVLFVSLGMWQLDRAGQKRALLAQATAGEESTVAATARTLDALPRYQRVQLTGGYDAQHQVLLDNMYSLQGRPGYRVLTPLQDAGGAWVLVDRGWIAPGATRAQLPHVGVEESTRTVIGRVDHLPRPGMRMGDETHLGAGWPRVLHYPTHAQLSQALQRQLAQHIVVLEADQPDGYERASRPLLHLDPGRHVGYAVQWFAFALVAIVIYILISRRTKGSTHDVA